MAESKPFWSSVPGVATGVAGVISAIVGLLGVSVQLGWIGGDDNGNGNGAATATTATGGATSTTDSTARGATTTLSVAARQGRFVVDPTSVGFEPLQPREVTVTVSNTGDVPLTMKAPVVTGSGDANFKVSDVSCTKSTLALGDTCEITVTFTPQRAGQYTAVLVVVASNAPQVDVALKGNAPLG